MHLERHHGWWWGLNPVLKNCDVFTLSAEILCEVFMMGSDGLIAYSKMIILSAMENICWRRGRWGQEEALTEKRKRGAK